MSDYEHGSMDISEHKKTFEGFVSFTTKSVVLIIIVLILMAMFAT